MNRPSCRITFGQSVPLLPLYEGERVVKSRFASRGLGAAGVSRMGSGAHLSIASWLEDWVMGVFVRWRISKRTVGRSRQNGACRSEGLGAGEHVPDRYGEPAGDIDLGDFGAALAAKAFLGALVAVVVGGVAAGGRRGFHQRPAQVLGPVLGQRARGGLSRRTERRGGKGRCSR